MTTSGFILLDIIIYLFFSVGLPADDSEDVVVAAWMKITSDKRLCLFKRKVFSSFPESGLKVDKQVLLIKWINSNKHLRAT